MQTRRLQPQDTNFPEFVYVLVQNVGGQDLVNGDVVVWSTTSKDGMGVTTTTTANSPLVAGVCIESIAQQAFGRIQVYGYHGAVNLLGATTNIAAADTLGTGTSTRKAAKGSTAGAILGFAYQAYTTDTTGKVFIKCM